MASIWASHDGSGDLSRRCQDLMKQVAPGMYAKNHGGCMSFGDQAADQVFLRPPSPKEEDERSEPGIYLQFWPGSTSSQARKLHESLNLDKLLALSREPAWCLESHFHLANAFKPQMKEYGTHDLKSYLQYWSLHVDQIQQYRKDREDFRAIGEMLARADMLSEAQTIEFKERFVNGDINLLRICPGLYMHFLWKPSEVDQLEKDGQLVAVARSRICEAFSCWGQKAFFGKVVV